MMFDFSEKKKAQVYDNLRSVMQICMEHLVKHNKDGKGRQDAEALRNDFAYAFHCMDLCSEYRWIPVAERLPEDRQLVLVCTKKSKSTLQAMFWRFGGEQCSEFTVLSGVFFPVDAVTHWMPLPEPPEEV